jgi:branched-chain amino acid transport system substrate-binding protein
MKRRVLIQGACAAAAASFGVVRASGRLRVGIPLPFTGVQAEVANDLRAGYEMAFAQAGRLGLAVEPVWADDLSQPDKTALLVDSFARDPSFVATSGIVGTPHAKAALPLARRGELPVVGIRSGASELRDGKPGVYHLRASFTDELTAIVKVIAGATLQRLAVVYSDDAFGKAAMAHVVQVAPTLGVSVVTNVPAERSGKDILEAVDRAVDPSGKAGALLLLVLEGPMLRATEHARTQRQFLHPVFCMSFCATRRLADAKDAFLEGLGLMSAFPLPRTALSPLAEGFRTVAADWHRPGVVNSLTSFEGYLYGSVLLRALQQAPELSRQGLVRAMSVPRSVGGVQVAFDSSNVGFRYLQLIYKARGGVLRA